MCTGWYSTRLLDLYSVLLFSRQYEYMLPMMRMQCGYFQKVFFWVCILWFVNEWMNECMHAFRLSVGVSWIDGVCCLYVQAVR